VDGRMPGLVNPVERACGGGMNQTVPSAITGRAGREAEPVSPLDSILTASDVENLFELFVRRAVGDQHYVQSLIEAGLTVRDLIRELRNSEEFALTRTRELGLQYSREMIDGLNYRTPETLQRTPATARKVLLVGSCLMDPWPGALSKSNPGFSFELVTFNNASVLPAMTAEEAAKFDYQVCQIPLRSVLRDSDYLNLKYDDHQACNSLLEKSKDLLFVNFDQICCYNAEFGMQTFLLNFVAPQQNPMGRLQTRYYTGNIIYFIEELNRHLDSLIRSRRNCYLVDFDQIVSTFGKKYYSDDVISHFNHASFLIELGNWDDRQRIEPLGSVTSIYTPDTQKYIQAVLSEVEGNFRTIQQIDSVKLVIFDLDDTLWRGVGAESDDIDLPKMTEGWPNSIVEAVSYLWRRGVLVAIVSKNDEKAALDLWDRLHGRRFSIKNFVAIRINWNPKAVNVGEILKAVNLSPSSVLFVDDNPVERAAVKAAFPEIRVMDVALVHWRRILLWAPELQQPVITIESAQRTEMIQAQIQREDKRLSLSRDEFLKGLSVIVRSVEITGSADPRFARSFELLNKTNQFNTTGRRWTHQEIEAFFAGDGRFLAFEVEDKFTKYGLTALILIAGDMIEQFVMSCRVFGLEIEKACLALACEKSEGKIKGKIKASGKNTLSMPLFQNRGFAEVGEGVWVFEGKPTLSVPDHISVEWSQDSQR
jgi:FkbH-like protein